MSGQIFSPVENSSDAVCFVLNKLYIKVFFEHRKLWHHKCYKDRSFTLVVSVAVFRCKLGLTMVSFVTDLWSAAVHGGKQRRQVTIRIYTIFCWSKVCLCLCEATRDKIPLYPLSCNTRKESFLLVKCLWHHHPFRKILYNIAFEYSRFFSLIAAGNVSRSLTRSRTNPRHQYGIFGIADVSHVKRPLQRGASGNGCIRSRLCTT